jgi:hypothetical protein
MARSFEFAKAAHKKKTESFGAALRRERLQIFGSSARLGGSP